jgi:hypothetical protein
MEPAYTGRAIIQDNITSLVITIPTKKNVFIIGFFCVWLLFWLLGETMVSGSILGGNQQSFGPFGIFWLCGWTIGGAFAISVLIWNLFGKEIITFSMGAMTIQRKGSVFYKAKTYDLNEAHNFKIDPVPQMDYFNRNRSVNNVFNPNTGTIKFDYGMKTIRFAEYMDEAEAFYILDVLRNKKLIKD